MPLAARRFALGALLPLAALGALAEGAPSLEEILERHAEARGGRAAWEAAETLELEGIYTAFSLEEPFRLLRERPGRFRFESTVRGEGVVLAHDGTAPWWVFPAYGAGWPQPVFGPDAARLEREAVFGPPLLAPPAGARLELVGAGEVDGMETLELRLTLADGSEETWHLDPESHLEVASDAIVFDFTQRPVPIEQRTYYSDFRRVGGLVLPFRLEREYGTRHTVLAVEEARLGVELEDDAFRRPPPEGMAALAGLAGRWRLEVESFDLFRETWEGSATSSEIVPVLGGAALEERFTYERSGVPIEVLRRYSWDRFQGVYRLTQLDDATSRLGVYEGVFEEGELRADTLATGTALEAFGREIAERLVLRELGPDGFRLDLERSFDAGETWQAVTRHVYECLP